MMLNSLKYAKQLEEAGLTRVQAETHMQIITEVMENHFALKQDVKDTEVAIRTDMKTIEVAIRADMKTMESALHHKIEATESAIRGDMNVGFQKVSGEIAGLGSEIKNSQDKTVIRLGTLATALVTALGVVMSILIKL